MPGKRSTGSCGSLPELPEVVLLLVVAMRELYYIRAWLRSDGKVTGRT